MGLTETPADDEVSLIRLTENFNRFILEQLQKEQTSNKLETAPTAAASIPQSNSNASPPAIIDQLFGSTSLSQSKCLSCKHETTRETRSFQYDMVYPENSSSSSSSNNNTANNPPPNPNNPLAPSANTPLSNNSNNNNIAGGKEEATFAALLKNSLKRESHTKAWCNHCGRYQLTEQRRALASVPNILCVNTAASKAVRKMNIE